ncbi:MAG: hypothetical protein V1809_15845 [Planctomycetota bacterium]
MTVGAIGRMMMGDIMTQAVGRAVGVVEGSRKLRKVAARLKIDLEEG